MSSLTKLASVLQQSPSLQRSLNTNQLLLFIDICCHLRQELDYTPSNSPHLPPLHLPSNIEHFLALAIFSDDNREVLDIISDAWKALGHFIWDTTDRVAPSSTLPLFLKYGPNLNLGQCCFSNRLLINMSYRI